jgi:hypothetical protein
MVGAPTDADGLLAAAGGAARIGTSTGLTVEQRLQRTTYIVDAITAVNATTLGLVDGDVVVARGRSAAGDVDFGFPFLVESSGTANGGTVFSLGAGLFARLQFTGPVDVRWFGSDGAAIQAALDTTEKDIFLSDGPAFVIANALNDANPVLTSTLDGRKIHGPGVITANAQVKKALSVTGDDSTISINVDGNNFIGYAVEVKAENPTVCGCSIKDLNGFDNWGGIAIRLDLRGGFDTVAQVFDNRISNVQGVGDGGATLGIGMNRAILLQNDGISTKKSHIYDNTIDAVEGEEGDAIVIEGGTAAAPLNFPVVISDNVIRGWSRRAIKVAASGVEVRDNTLTNDISAPIASLQRAIDVTAGSDITIKGNTLVRCNYQQQIGVYQNSPQVSNNVFVEDNTIVDVANIVSGSPTDLGDLINLRTYGDHVVVKGNTIVSPDHIGGAISVIEADDVMVSGNNIDINNTNWFDDTNSTNVKLGQNTLLNGGDWTNCYDRTNNEFLFDVTSGQAITLYNSDTSTTDAQSAGAINCRQNDESTYAISAALGFVFEGTTGQTAVAISTGTRTGMSERWRVRHTGNLRPATDDANDIGTAALRVKDTYTKNVRPGAGTAIWTSGAGTPEGAVTATVGSLYTRTDGGATTTLYVKESGSGNTGWIAK